MTVLDPFDQRIAVKRQHLADELEDTPLRVAVLGPDLENSESPGARKRIQIAKELLRDGHDPFFPEDELPEYDPSISWIEHERALLSESDVGLVIILDTDDSAGVLIEIGNFVSVPEIKFKTAVLIPFKHYRPMENLPANTVQAFFARMQYTDEQFEKCHIVAECRRWASDRKRDIWPRISPERF